MIQLLDVNLLIAVVDPDHPHFASATRFFKKAVVDGWATCPLTENAFVRILGHPKYIPGPGSTALARSILASYVNHPGHQFWPDELSLCDAIRFPVVPDSKSLTDQYLLALAVKRGGAFATFDQSIDPTLIPGGRAALNVLSPG